MKRKYFEPGIEIVKFGTEDIITTSGTEEWEEGPGGNNGDDFGGDDFSDGVF